VVEGIIPTDSLEREGPFGCGSIALWYFLKGEKNV